MMIRKTINEKEQKIAGDLLDDIQYNLIHLVDCLREQKKEELAVMSLNFLTALLSISMRKHKFIPCSKPWSFHMVLPAKQTLNAFLDSKSALLESLDILSPKFTPNDKIMLQNSFKKIEESKFILFNPFFDGDIDSEYCGYPHPYIKSDRSLGMGQYKQQKNPYFVFGLMGAMLEPDFGRDAHIDLQSAYLFPCFQSFCTNYQNERSNISKLGKSISQRLFSQKSHPQEMYQLIESKRITTFREVVCYALNHDSSRSVDVLKKYYNIDFNIPEILKLLEKSLPKDLNQIVIGYYAP